MDDAEENSENAQVTSDQVVDDPTLTFRSMTGHNINDVMANFEDANIACGHLVGPSNLKVLSIAAHGIHNAKAIFENVKLTFGHLIDGLSIIKWKELPHKVKEHIVKNPKMSALRLVSLLVMLVPGLVAGPALTVLGFSSIGPVAGSAAAAFQSANGATALFSTLQSAAMGGYGVAVVNAVIQGASGLVAGVAGFIEWLRKGSGDEEGGEAHEPKPSG